MNKYLLILLLSTLLSISDTQQIQSGYSARKDKCASSKCKEFTRSDVLLRDMCLHRCIHQECFTLVYGDLLSHESPTYFKNRKEETLEAYQRKDIFIKCVDGDIPPRSYKNLRQQCAQYSCKIYNSSIDVESIQRELCLLECINPNCFYNLYDDFASNFNFKPLIDLHLRLGLKEQFMSCLDQEKNRKIPDIHFYLLQRQEEIERVNINEVLSLQFATEYCSQKPECEKTQRVIGLKPSLVFKKEFCIQECADKFCFDYIYGDLVQISEIIQYLNIYYNTIKPIRKQLFKQCWIQSRVQLTYFDNKIEVCEEKCEEKQNELLEELCYLRCQSPICHEFLIQNTDVNKVIWDTELDDYILMFQKCIYLEFFEIYNNYIEKYKKCKKGCEHWNQLKDFACIHTCISEKCYSHLINEFDILDYISMATSDDDLYESEEYYEFVASFVDCLTKKEEFVFQNVTNEQTTISNEQCRAFVDKKPKQVAQKQDSLSQLSVTYSTHIDYIQCIYDQWLSTSVFQHYFYSKYECSNIYKTEEKYHVSSAQRL